jgi:hypothetical protein
VARSRGAAADVADTLRNDDLFKDVAFLIEVLRPQHRYKEGNILEKRYCGRSRK